MTPVTKGVASERSPKFRVNKAGPTVWAPFPHDTDYFGRPEQQVMLNFRVRDLAAMLAQLRVCVRRTLP